MGRKKLHRPIEELIAERRERQMRYYERNKEEFKQKCLERYHKNKRNLHNYNSCNLVRSISVWHAIVYAFVKICGRLVFNV